MRHGIKFVKLGRRVNHRHAMLNNLATSVLLRGLSAVQMERSVVTTIPKAKAVRGLVERLITYAKKGDLSARRQAAKFVKDPEVLKGLFETLGSRYAARQGGYTRVLKLGDTRQGDSAELAMISLVEDELATKPARKPAPKAKTGKKVNITKKEVKAESAPTGEKPVSEAGGEAPST